MRKELDPAQSSVGVLDSAPQVAFDVADAKRQGKIAGALVLGGDYRALTVVRSLGRRGIPVWVFPEHQKIATKSRYALRHMPLPSEEKRQVEFLLNVGRRFSLDGWVLFPTEDTHAAMIARHQAKLATVFRLATASWETVEVAYDKRLTYRVAEKFGVHTPMTFYPRDRREVEALQCRFPVILKPAIKEAVNRFTREKAWPIDDKASLMAAYEVACGMIDPGLIMIQELIPGDGEAQFSFGAICENGRTIASVVARRARQYPVDFGRSSSYVETVDEPAVEHAGKHLLEALRYTGVMEAEFKYDARDGRYKLLDLNPRVWGWHTLARPGGVDFPYFMWRLAQNSPVPEVRVKAGYRWVRMTTDLPAAVREILSGKLSLGSYLRSLRSPLEHAVMAADDPMPFVLEVPMLAATRLTERFREFRHGPGPAAPTLAPAAKISEPKRVAASTRP